MSTEFLAETLWPELKKTARASRQRCAVAVAYFGKGASKLLPLPKGSRLVVDASEGAVKSGQTCPADLLAMTKRGIRVYSITNLHAKVFVLGRVAFVGSANVSNRSAGTLIEAAVRLTDPLAVKAARKFVTECCLDEQTPTQLKRLNKLYRPPRIAGGGGLGIKKISKASTKLRLPQLRMVQLVLQDWSEQENALHDAGEGIAKKRCEHPRSHELDSFLWTGECRFAAGDQVVQVTDEGSGKKLVSPPGKVIYVRSRVDKKLRRTSIVFVERPAIKRRQIKTLTKQMRHGAGKRLKSNGVVRDMKFYKELMGLWNG